VSESQREFIDLAFRMALMQVAAWGGVGTLTVDAPESSLDAVFTRRAADVLLRFAQNQGNRLVLTSNLVEGQLIPSLIRPRLNQPARKEPFIDLFQIAAPTAAIREHKAEYDAAIEAVLKQVT
jgi:hypothetical protein